MLGRVHAKFSFRKFIILLLPLLVGLLVGCASPSIDGRRAGPWNLLALAQNPGVQWGSRTGLVQELFYEGEPFGGKPTRIFAYLGRPLEPTGRRQPGLVLVHGGGGTAFKAWAEHWASRGYVALAMDLSGHGPNGRLPDGGPDQSDQTKFRDFTEAEIGDMWTYHAVAAVLRGHSLLRHLPEVDPDRIGLTGISWGGYLTCMVAGIDSRFKVAVPVYGCGFLGENSAWTDKWLAGMKPEARALWLRTFDPSQYLGGVRCPILFVNGTTDFAYPMDSYQKSYRLVPTHWRHVSMAVNRPHGHIWTFPEVDAFVDSVLRGGPPLVTIGPPRVKNDTLAASLDQSPPLREASLCYTTNSGPWQKRTWETTAARVENLQIKAELPSARPLVAYLAITDKEGRQVSSEHVELK